MVFGTTYQKVKELREKVLAKKQTSKNGLKKNQVFLNSGRKRELKKIIFTALSLVAARGGASR